MSKVQTLEKLNCWKSTKELAIFIYQICEQDKFKAEFFAKKQLKHTAFSSMNNIAEGFGRFSNKELIDSLNISIVSLEDLSNMISLYSKLGYISGTDTLKLIEYIKKAKHHIISFIKYLKNRLDTSEIPQNPDTLKE